MRRPGQISGLQRAGGLLNRGREIAIAKDTSRAIGCGRAGSNSLLASSPAATSRRLFSENG